MASDPTFVQFVIDQLAPLEGITTRKMFGEYAVYHGAKVVALVCDNQLFVKPTKGGRRILGCPIEAPAYLGAKPSFLVSDLDDRARLSELIMTTSAELPIPKAKKPMMSGAERCAT